MSEFRSAPNPVDFGLEALGPMHFHYTQATIERSHYKPRLNEAIDWTRPLYDSDGNQHLLCELGAVQVVTAMSFVRVVFDRRSGVAAHDADDLLGMPLKLSNVRPSEDELMARKEAGLRQAYLKAQMAEGGFHGLKHLYRSSDGYVHWKGQNIEHYSFSDSFKESNAAVVLAAQCAHLESLGQAVHGASLHRLWGAMDLAEAMPTPKYLLNYNLISLDLPAPKGAFRVPQELLARYVTGTPMNAWFHLQPVFGSHEGMRAAQKASFPGGAQPSALRSQFIATRDQAECILGEGIFEDIKWMARFHGSLDVRQADGTTLKVSPPRIGDFEGLAAVISDAVRKQMPFVGELPSKKKVQEHVLGEHLVEAGRQRDNFYAADTFSRLALLLSQSLTDQKKYQEGAFQTFLNEFENPNAMTTNTYVLLKEVVERLDEQDVRSEDDQHALLEASRLIDTVDNSATLPLPN